jgi:hypothetical protein
MSSANLKLLIDVCSGKIDSFGGGLDFVMVGNQLFIFLTFQASRDKEYQCHGISTGLIEKRNQSSGLVVGGKDFDYSLDSILFEPWW